MEIMVWHETGKVPVTFFGLKGDLTSEEPLESRARSEFDGGTRDIVLDLSHVDYISSAGLRAIHAIYMLLRSVDKEDEAAAATGIARGTYKSPHLKLVKPSRNATKALSTAGYDMFLETYDNNKKALESFG